MNYRVNFGNGQVHECRSLRDAKNLLAAQFDGPGSAFIQKRGDSPSGWVAA
jgi:hypothetical protein